MLTARSSASTKLKLILLVLNTVTLHGLKSIYVPQIPPLGKLDISRSTLGVLHRIRNLPRQ